MTKEERAAEKEREARTVASLSKHERAWLKRRVCGFCEIGMLSTCCGGYSGEMELPAIEGVRDEPELIDLGPPCNMDEKRAKALAHYKPRPNRRRGEQ